MYRLQMRHKSAALAFYLLPNVYVVVGAPPLLQALCVAAEGFWLF